LVRSGRIHRLVRDAARFGTVVQQVTLDWPAVMRRQADIVREFQPRPDALRRAGVDVVLGDARFTDAHTVTVGDTALRTDKIVIGAGSAPVVPALPGRDLALTSDDLLFLPDFPRRLVLVGAGVIGLEMAGAFSDLGAAVTVIGSENEILSGFDLDVGAYARAILETRGVTFHLGASVTQFSGQRGAVTTTFTQEGRTREVAAEQVCVAVGRRWRPESVGAEHLGLAMGDRGLAVSAHLKTSIGHIYAAGDAAGNAQLTPVAAYEGRLAARNALEGDHLTVDEAVVPQTVFTTPEVAKVGLTHAAARARGIPCHVARHDMRGASNGRATGEDDGYLSLVFDPGSERLLGVQLVSYAAAELIQLAALAVRMETTAKFLAEQISVHPSHTERFIKIAAHEYHETCEIPGVPPGA
jgi:pyruvate/2-oxoglutarate dehydrogenase complex dihydrolipoamide dehydrogenase (E3) component